MARTDAELAPDIRIDEPRMYRVVMHNDDTTTMDFVIEVLRQIFNKNQEEATAIMWAVHNNGAAVCGVYPHELAEARVGLTRRAAKRAGYPLKCTLERD